MKFRTRFGWTCGVWRRRPLQTMIFCLLALIAANTVFLSIRIAGTFLSKSNISAQIDKGFIDGAISPSPWPISKRLIGIDQFSDCVSFELALVGNDTRIREALAPRFFGPFTGSRCHLLARYISTGEIPKPLLTYTRFWHGHATVTALALQLFDLVGYRQFLVMLSYLAITGVAIICVLLRRDAWPTVAPLMLAAFMFSGIGSFGPLVSHTPAIVTGWLYGGILLVVSRDLQNRWIPIIAVLSGSTQAFLDMMISVPLSMCLILFFANVGVPQIKKQLSVCDIIKFNVMLAICWSGGLVGTYAIKLLLTMAVAEPSDVMGGFLRQLTVRMGGGGGEGGSPWLTWSQLEMLGFGRVVASLKSLGYGEADVDLATATIAYMTIGGWFLGLFIATRDAWKRRTLDGFRVGVASILPSIALALWYFIFPQHTVIHAWFTVRPTIFWIAGGWSWFGGQWAAERRLGSSARELADASLSPRAPILSQPTER